MKKILSITALFALLLFVSGKGVFAENSASISVSATVPAIPGVNSPLLEVQNKRLPQQNQPQQLPLTIQEETKEEKASSENQDNIVLVKTFYVR
jgi:hypothetical protein